MQDTHLAAIGRSRDVQVRHSPRPRLLLAAIVALTLASPWLALAGSEPRAASDAPVALVVSRVDGDVVTFTWMRPLTGGPPQTYVLEGGLWPGETLATIDIGSAMPVYTVRLPRGVFYVRVRASASSVMSAPSNEVRVVVDVPEPPSAPLALLGLVDGSSLLLSWTSTFTGGPATGMTLFVAGPVGGALPLGLVERFDYTAAPPGTYTFAVMSTNAAGVSGLSNPVTLTFPGPCTGPPDAPSHLVATAAGRTVTVQWQPPPTGPAVSRYRLIVGTPGDRVPGSAAEPSPQYTFSVFLQAHEITADVPPDGYTFLVVAENACGAGGSSGPVSILVQ